MPLSRFSLVLISSLAIAQADVKLPAIFSDHAVLEKSAKVPVWGKADPGEKVSVTLDTAKAEATTGEDGKWNTTLDLSQSAAGPFELTVTGKNKVTLADILVGDVWICSGQSNMAFSLQSAIGGKDDAAQANFPQLRLFTIQRAVSKTPLEDCEGKWEVCSPTSANAFSAVGFYFGRMLQKDLQIPIGLIHTSWGGTPSESWTSAEALDSDPDLKSARTQMATAIEAYPKLLENYLTGLPAWEAKNNRADRGTGALPDDEGWKTLKLPGEISESGAVWLKKTVTITPELVGKNLRLDLKGISGLDTVYWNGKKLGETTLSASVKGPERSYSIPNKEAGEFSLLIRLFNSTSKNSLLQPFGIGTSIPLTGEWQMKPEFELPIADKVVLAEAPPFPGKDPLNAHTASALFNGMINPLVPYAIKGAIWYQGESNAGRAFQYRKAFPLMITDWRTKWNQGHFPFYFAQIANFMAKTPELTGANWAELREAQTMTQSLPKTGQAILIDIGESDDIHPRNKKDVGERLALIALAKDYGKKVVFSGPTYDSFKIIDDKIQLSFKDTEGGLVAKPLPATYVTKNGLPEKPYELYSPSSEIQGFAICGEDQQWVWADAKIEGTKVIVSSPKVTKPVAVRYAWAQNPTCNLYNGAGLPAGPFRTDDFAISTLDKKYGSN